MTLREVALDRDMRATPLLPSAARLFSSHVRRRAFGVATLVILDVGALLLAVALVSRLSAHASPAAWHGLTLPGLATACAAVVMSALINGLYGRRYARHNARKAVSAWIGAALVSTILMLMLDPDGIDARLVLLWLLAAVLSLGGRWCYDALLSLVFGSEGENPPALLLGDLESCLEALPALRALPPEARVSVVGLVIPSDQQATACLRSAGEPPVVAAEDELARALKDTGAAEVIIADRDSLNGRLQTVMEVCRAGGVALKIAATDLQLGGEAVCYVPGLECPVFVVRPKPAGRASFLVKRAGDYLLAATLVLVLSPVLVVITVAIKLTSPGRVFFTDERVGIGQRPFRCYKFRTMVADAKEHQLALEAHNEAGGVLFKMRDDPRVTPIGRVLRRTSLDELPQLFNVLKGDMSLIGPRPLPLRDCDLMEEWHRQRHVVYPGLTGLWQVYGRSDLSFDDMIRLDSQYIETWSLRSDLHIAWRTFGAVFASRGAR